MLGRSRTKWAAFDVATHGPRRSLLTFSPARFKSISFLTSTPRPLLFLVGPVISKAPLPSSLYSKTVRFPRLSSSQSLRQYSGTVSGASSASMTFSDCSKLTYKLLGTVERRPQSYSVARRIFNFIAISVSCTLIGFAMATAPIIPVVNGMITPPSDEETLQMFEPADEESKEIEHFINDHPLVRSLRANPDFTESRPHMKIPEALRASNLTGGTLAGPGRIVVPPSSWSERGGESLVSIFYLGKDLCGHPGIVHGGLLATILDEGLARCCFPALPNKIAMTASLNINYRKPAPGESYVVLKAKTVKVEGRKAWVEGHIETLPAEGEEPVVLVEASALFIEPKQAAVSALIRRIW